ncbi:Cation-independent mannose-6-phosphate receptor CI-MPR [Arachnomyces sp. PD_36]|nr:Cation-independent mannose-6-phosphate receptor CI-MPR [Arachnomyces sp. PD_36]
MNLMAIGSFLSVQLLLHSASVVAYSTSKPWKPCTLHSPNTGSFFDLNPISLTEAGIEEGYNDDRNASWHAKGYDYPANFTLNFCAPVLEELDDVVGLEPELWQNVSAYYEMGGEVYSIGQQSSTPFFRGRKLVLNYTDGSPCPSTDSTFALKPRKLLDSDDEDEEDEDDTDEEDDDDNHEDGDDDDDDSGLYPPPSDGVRRKSTIMSFLCDRDPVAPSVTISFVGTPDSCSYFFEVRSPYACGGAAASPDEGLGPAGVFGVIFGIAVAVYLIGGCAYQRTVMHQRGWRQCPNSALWVGILLFFKDLIVLGFYSLSNCIRRNDYTSASSGGYSRTYANDSSNTGSGDRSNTSSGQQRSGLVGAIGGRGTGSGSGGRGTGQRSNVDEENRLIDQLDEEWDD